MPTLIHFLNFLTAGQLVFFTLCFGVIEFAFGLYGQRWTKNQRYLDLACFVLPRLVLRPASAYLGFKLMSVLLPAWRNTFNWLPFFWGFFIICIADDLTNIGITACIMRFPGSGDSTAPTIRHLIWECLWLAART